MTDSVPQMPRSNTAIDFWQRVDRRGEHECWPWIGVSVGRGGYGYFRMEGRQMGAHRLALELHLGRRIADGMHALHACDNPPCCNPAHLYEGTDADNAADSVARGRRATGVRHGLAKLDPVRVAAIRAERDEGATLRALATRHQVGYNAIWRVVNGITWRDA